MSTSGLFSTTTISVLIIDDNQEDRRQWADRLKDCSPDYHVLEASDGRSGLELCQTSKIDCVVLDLDLPDMSGFEVLFTLNPDDAGPQVAVVVLTRLLNASLHKMAKEHGAQETLVKFRASGPLLHQAVTKAIDRVELAKGRRHSS